MRERFSIVKNAFGKEALIKNVLQINAYIGIYIQDAFYAIRHTNGVCTKDLFSLQSGSHGHGQLNFLSRHYKNVPTFLGIFQANYFQAVLCRCFQHLNRSKRFL